MDNKPLKNTRNIILIFFIVVVLATTAWFQLSICHDNRTVEKLEAEQERCDAEIALLEKHIEHLEWILGLRQRLDKEE